MPLTAGIDLGTTNSCIAIFRNGTVKIINTENEKNTIPSFVFYDDNGKVLVGASAITKAPIRPKNGIYDVKRMIGCKYKDENLQQDKKLWAFDVTESENGECEITVNRDGKNLKIRPEQVSAEVLSKLKQGAEKAIKEKIVNVVITVPAYFTNSQKQATKDAAQLAGLNVRTLINEPTAAALAFTYNEQIKNQTVLVYDLGGGTFDVSVIRTDNGKITVLGVGGDNHLGGRDFDKNLLIYILEEIEKKYSIIIEGKNKRRLVRRLEQKCENIKIELSEIESKILEIEELNERDIELRITRKIFEDINKELFDDTIKIMDQLLREKKIKKESIDEVLLVGGSTRIPKIQTMISEYFNGKKLNKRVHPDEAVGIGAAIRAALLSENPSQKCNSFELFDVVPRSLGIEVAAKNTMSVLIEKNTRVPYIVRKTYYTCIDFQSETSIRIFEGESNLVEENIFLGELKIEGITPKPAGDVEFLVQFALDSNGILKIEATEDSKDLKKNLDILLVDGRMTQKEIKNARLK